MKNIPECGCCVRIVQDGVGYRGIAGERLDNKYSLGLIFNFNWLTPEHIIRVFDCEEQTLLHSIQTLGDVCIWWYKELNK